MDELKSILLLGAFFLILFVIAELLHRKLNIASEITRKIVHIFTGLLALLFPYFFNEWWPVALLCGTFLLILFVSQRTRQLSSINKINRRSYGSLLYPIAVFVCFITLGYMKDHSNFFNPICYYALPIVLLAICDPLAAFAGSVYKKRADAKEGKTWAGTIAFFIAAATISFFFLRAASSRSGTFNPFFATIIISLTTAIGERLSKNGWDNLVIPLATISSLYVLNELA